MNVEVRQMKTAAELSLAETFESAKGRLPGLRALREDAFRRFEAQGLPHRRIEEWKYTDLRALMRDAKPLAAPPDAAAKARAKDSGALLRGVNCRRLVLVDGVFAPDLSDLTAEPGVTIRGMAEALAAGDALVARHVGKVIDTDDIAVSLNTALMGDGVVIDIAEGAAAARPILLVYASSGRAPASMFARSLAVVGRKARVTLLESHEAAADDQANVVTELLVGDEAEVEHVKLVSNRDGALQLSTLIAAIGARARFDDLTCTIGGAVTRNQLYVRYGGEDTVSNLRGVSLLRGRQHADTTLVVDHAAPGCQSRELFKSVLDDDSRGVFQGRIGVQAHAQKTDAKMAAHALLLSENAEADSKPELEIFADDVQCGHGSTAGALDEDLLFYLRARGIPAREAEALMVTAFVGEVIEGVAHEGVREALLATTDAWLGARA